MKIDEAIDRIVLIFIHCFKKPRTIGDIKQEIKEILTKVDNK